MAEYDCAQINIKSTMRKLQNCKFDGRVTSDWYVGPWLCVQQMPIANNVVKVT